MQWCFNYRNTIAIVKMDAIVTPTCCEACALTLFLDDKKLEQAQEEPLLGLNIDPILSCLNCVTNLRKKLSLKIKIKYHIILFNASKIGRAHV